MDEGGSIAQREKANQEHPVTIGAVAGMAPDVEQSFMVQDMTANENQEQAAPGEGSKTAMPDAAHKVADAVPERVKEATDMVPESVKSAADTDATNQIKKDSGASFK